MNRNTETHFSELPNINIKRSTFDLSHGHKTTFNVGSVIPLLWEEVLPGDTFDLTTSAVIRLQTLIDPIFDNIYFDTFAFYVRNELLWKHWREFCGEDTYERHYDPKDEYLIPRFCTNNGRGVDMGSVADYLGVPINVDFTEDSSTSVSAFPFRAYQMIVDEFFRDQNYIPPSLFDKGDGPLLYNATDYDKGGKPFRAARFHDYFSSVLPKPQAGGDPVSFNLINGDKAPVVTGEYHNPYGIASGFDNYGQPAVYTDFKNNWQTMKPEDNSAFNGYLWPERSSFSPSYPGPFNVSWHKGANSKEEIANALTPINLWADISSTVGAVTINQLRIANSLQTFYEALQRGGTRYPEIVRSLFGVTSLDARSDRPEFLGSQRIQLNIHQVTNTSTPTTDGDHLGDVGAMSVTSDVSDTCFFSATEHGIFMVVGVARYDHSYPQGLAKKWTRKTFIDYYNPYFSNLGEVPVFTYEIFASPGTLGSEHVFGFQECWSEYRFEFSRCSGELSPAFESNLASWTLADYYDPSDSSKFPVPSEGWISEPVENLDRALAVKSSEAHQFFADFYFNLRATRPIPMYSIPSLSATL